MNEKLLTDHLDEEAEQLETTELMAGFELSIADVAFMPVLVKLQRSCTRLLITTEADKCYCAVHVQCCCKILVQQILASSVNPRFTRFGVSNRDHLSLPLLATQILKGLSELHSCLETCI